MEIGRRSSANEKVSAARRHHSNSESDSVAWKKSVRIQTLFCRQVQFMHHEFSVVGIVLNQRGVQR
jgi:hypothetical protein